MSSAKPAILTAAVIVGLAAIPLFWQESKAKHLRGEIGQLEERRTTAAAKIARHEAAIRAFEAAPSMENTRTVRELLDYSQKRIDVDEMMSTLMNVMMSQDIIGMLKVFLPLAELDHDEYTQLLEDLENYNGNAQTKRMVMQMMTMFAPTTAPGEALERLVRLEVEPYSYSNLLGQWAADEPDAALAWYQTKLEAGELDGKGIDSKPEQYLLSELIQGMAKGDPKRGVDFFFESIGSSDIDAYSTLSGLATSLGTAMQKSSDDSQLRRLLEWDAGIERTDHSNSIVQSAMGTALRDREFSEVTRFAETYLNDSEDQHTAVISYVNDQRDAPLAERATNLIAYLPEDRAPDAIRQITNAGYRSNSIDPATRDWVESQPPGAVRDAGWQGIIENHSLHQSYPEAFALVDNIGDESIRTEALSELGRDWFRNDEETARAQLPPQIIAEVEEAQTSRGELNVRTTSTTITHDSATGETVETVEYIEESE
jgi:hypothetical protein